MVVRVKICGITNVEDAKAAVDAGADAIGLVFYGPSPRCVDVATAASIAQTVGPFVTTVGLFVNASKLEIDTVLAEVPLQLLQFHGDETPEFCQQFQRPYMKALRMKPDIDVLAELQRYQGAQAILLDAYRKGVPGGTGETFDWARVPKSSHCALVLAGGLTSENVADAVVATEVYGVDVSGGVEATAGRKSTQKLQEFIARAKA